MKSIYLRPSKSSQPDTVMTADTAWNFTEDRIEWRALRLTAGLVTRFSERVTFGKKQ